MRRRKIIKKAHETLRHAKHVRNMREDILRASELEALSAKETALHDALAQPEPDVVRQATEALYALCEQLAPRGKHSAIRENLEVIVVAVAVAMGVRTYFLQPFKIPTGSMQPTLYGITSRHQPARTIADRLPLRPVKWLITGEWHRHVVVKKDTEVLRWEAGRQRNDPSNWHCYVRGRRRPYKIPVDAMARDRMREIRGDPTRECTYAPPGAFLTKGTVLWSGVVVAGDHVFVDKVRWVIRKPRRDSVVVFNTDNINMTPPVPPGTHYIKRLVGLPNESISIDPPTLLVNGEEPVENGISAVRYGIGYQVIGTGGTSPHALRTKTDAIQLGPKQYFALGDNQRSSKDGRYWGSVDHADLVGPACFIYWPFFRRSGQGSYRVTFGPIW